MSMEVGDTTCCLVPHSGEIDTGVPVIDCALPLPDDSEGKDDDDAG